MAAITLNTGDFTNSSYAPAYVEALWGANKALGTALADSTTLTNILPSAANTCFSSVGEGFTLPAGLLNTLGCYFRLEVDGTIASTGTPTIIVAVALTDSAASPNTVTVATTPTYTTTAITGTRPFHVSAVSTCVATGATGTLRSQGVFTYDSSTALLGVGLVSTAASNVNLAIANTVKLNVTWGAASTSNTIVVTNARLYVGLTNG